MLLGWVGAIRAFRTDARARVLLVYGGVILFPLFVIGNKQAHYLVPVTPVLAMLAAYAVDRAVRPDAAPIDALVARLVFWTTVAVSFAAPVVVLVVSRKLRGGAFNTTDLALAIILLMTLVATTSTGQRHGLVGGVCAYAAGLALVLAVTFGRWLPSLNPVTHRTIAAELRKSFGGGPYVFYGENLSYPLAWNLRTVVPQCKTEADVRAALADDPETVVIAQTKNKVHPPPVPPELSHMGDLIEEKDSIFSIYAIAP